MNIPAGRHTYGYLVAKAGEQLRRDWVTVDADIFDDTGRMVGHTKVTVPPGTIVAGAVPA